MIIVEIVQTFCQKQPPLIMCVKCLLSYVNTTHVSWVEGEIRGVVHCIKKQDSFCQDWLSNSLQTYLEKYLQVSLTWWSSLYWYGRSYLRSVLQEILK